MVQRKQVIDGDLSDRTSLIHLLDNNDSEDNNEAHIVKHSPYYSETDFSKLLQKKDGLSILILLNQISDHQMIFTLIENFSYVTQVPKFVEIQVNDPDSIQNFVNELDELNIYNHLQTAIGSSPDVNYDTMLELLSTVKDKHLPKKWVKFNRKKHKMAKWMTNGLLKSINTKDKLYKKLVKRDVDGNAQYTTLKKEFNIFKNTLRSSINEAKRLYYLRTFALYKNDVKQTWA